MEWIVGLVVFALSLALLPSSLRAFKKSSKAKGRVGGAIMSIGLALLAVVDPPSKTATEEIEKNKGRRNQEDAEGSE